MQDTMLVIFIILVTILFVVALVIYSKTKKVFEKYKKYPCSINMTGKELINYLNNKTGENVHYKVGKRDAYMVGKRIISLKPYTYNAKSINSTAITIHEYGHFYKETKVGPNRVLLAIRMLRVFELLLFIPLVMQDEIIIYVLAFVALIVIISASDYLEEYKTNKIVKNTLLPLLDINEEEENYIMDNLKHAIRTYSWRVPIEVGILIFIIYF